MGDGGLFVAMFVVALCAGVGAIITSGKNRGGITGLLLGLLLGPIGVVVALLFRPGWPDAPAGMRSVRCARCNTPQNIPADATSADCWQCGLTMNVPANL